MTSNWQNEAMSTKGMEIPQTWGDEKAHAKWGLQKVPLWWHSIFYLRFYAKKEREGEDLTYTEYLQVGLNEG